MRALLEGGVNVSLGTDGCCSTSSTNMLTALGTAAGLGKIRDTDYRKWLTANEALHAATVGGATALGLADRLGTIEVGRSADLVAYRLDAIPFVPLSDPVRQLVYAERGASISDVLVEGEWVMRDGQLARIDELAILREINASFATLEDTFQAAEASVGPLHAAMAKVVERCLAEPIAPDTYPARFDAGAP